MGGLVGPAERCLAPMNDLVKSILTFATAWLLIIGSLLFLERLVKSLENPDFAALPEASLGIIIGGLIAILTMAGQFVFQSEAARSTARAIGAASDSAAKNALSQPGSPTTTTMTTPEGATTITEPPGPEPKISGGIG
jgi:hypothetical protein